MKNGVRVAICVMLVVTVLAMSLSVFADSTPEPLPSPTPDPLMELNYRAAMQIIYNCMNAWGIEIEYNGYKEFGNEISQILEGWVIEFLDSLPSQYTISTWIAPWQADFDYWGNSRYNQSALDDIQQFVDWLVTKLSLVNNDYVPILSPGNNIGTYIVYDTPVSLIRRDAFYGFVVETIRGSDAYILFTTNDNQWFRMTYIANSEGSIIQKTTTYNNNTSDTVIVNVNQHNTDSTLWYNYDTGSYSYVGSAIDLQGYEVYNMELPALAFFDQFDEITAVTEQVGVLTSVIELPADNPNYSAGDSIVIVAGEPEYQVVEWPDSVSVDNLPAIVSTGTVTNPGLDTFWGFIPVLAEQTKDAIVLARGLIYELPEELVVTFYAVMGGLILFGVIKLMREH